MKKYLFLIGFLFLISQSEAQYSTSLSEVSMSALGNLDPNSPIYFITKGDKPVIGSQYKGDEWTRGQIRLKDINAFSETVEILLDLEQHKLYFRFMDKPDDIGELKTDEVAALIMMFEGDTLMYEVHDLNKRIGDAPEGMKYYRILHAGDYVLLNLENKYMRREAYVENLGLVRRPDEYKERNYYFLIKGNKFHKISKNLKSFDSVFPKHRENLKDLVKSNRLKLSKDADLIKFVTLIERNEPQWSGRTRSN